MSSRQQRVDKRSDKRKNVKGYEKRELTNDTVCRHILFPVVLSSIGKPNDFFFHALSLQWNCKNTSKDYRCQELIRGLHLEECVNIENLARSKETGWFKSSKKSDLAKIGKVAGYFLRIFACSVGQAVDENFTDLSLVDGKDFNDLINQLKDDKTIVPAIIKLEISRHSHFDASKLMCLNEEQVNKLVNGNEIIATRRAKVLEISTDLHDWAWIGLNLASVETRTERFNDAVPISVDIVPHNGIVEDLASVETRTERLNDGVPISVQKFDVVPLRPPSCRTRQPNKKYL